MPLSPQLHGTTQKGRSLGWRNGPLFASDPLSVWQGLLSARGLHESDAFFSPQLADLPDPEDMQDMTRAVERLLQAVEKREHMHVFGDFDCDGVCGTAILTEALRATGIEASSSIPHRADDGHGIGVEAVREAHESGCTLGISVDTGTTCFAACSSAKELGFDLIVTDHHLPEENLPDAYAVLNPARADCGFAGRRLCGTGVGFFLLMGIWKRLKEKGCAPDFDLRQLLDRVAIATVADVMPLTGVNRILVYYGLRQMETGPCPGMAALMQTGRVKGPVTVQDIGFQLAPRINAAGRMQHGDQAMHLLRAADAAEAAALAADLDECNRLRQQVERETLKKVEEYLAAEPDDILAVYDPSWHAGVVGLVAGRLARRHGRPAAVGFVEPGGSIRVSLRGVPGFHVGQILESCSGYLDHFGGHSGAGGGGLAAENWDGFKRAFANACEQHGGDVDDVRKMEIDGVLTTGTIHAGLVDRLGRFEPCGQGNPGCMWLLEGGSIINRQELRAGAVRLRYAADDGYVDAIAFRAAAIDSVLQPGSAVGLVGKLQLDRFRGRGAVQFVVEDALTA